MYKDNSICVDSKIKNNIMDKILLFFYAFYFILNPFYLWKSGIPQIADIAIILSLIIYIFQLKGKFFLNKNDKKILVIGLLFITWIFLINSIWTLKLQQTHSFLLSSLYYIYNYIIFFYTLILHHRYGSKMLKTVYISVLISILVQLIIYLTQGGYTGSRHIGSFNNPNQLGYYALSIMCLIIFLSNRIKIKFIPLFTSLIISIFFVFLSLSKASMLSAVGLITFYLISRSSNKILKKKVLITFVVLAMGIGILYNKTNLIQNNSLFNSVQRRVDTIGQDKDDSLEGRGYDRIYKYPEYWLFGAGEGAYNRFNNQKIEFHSTVGNIQVSYGLIGLILFLVLIVTALNNDSYQSWYIVLFLMMYGLTHNGIRSGLLWTIIALININPTVKIIENDMELLK